MHTHLRHVLPFPQIPMALNVCAFEFLIMTENYLRYFEIILPAEMRRHLLLNREKILDQHMWQNDSALLAHLRDRDLATHFSRELESCNRGAVAQRQPQASPMVVRSLRSPAASWLSPPRPLPRAGAAAAVAAAAAAAADAGEGGLSALMTAGLASSLGQSHAEACKAQAASAAASSDNGNHAAPADSKADKVQGAAAQVAACRTTAAQGRAETQPAGGAANVITPERVDSKLASTSAAPTPLSDKNAKAPVQKQLTSVARVRCAPLPSTPESSPFTEFVALVAVGPYGTKWERQKGSLKNLWDSCDSALEMNECALI